MGEKERDKALGMILMQPAWVSPQWSPAMGRSTCHSGSCFSVCSLTAQLVPTGKPQPRPIHSQQKHASNLYVWRVYFNYTPPKRGRWTHEWTQQRTSSDEELLVSNEWEGRADSHLANWLFQDVPSQISNVNVLNITEQDMGTNTSMLNSMEHENLQYCERQSLAVWKTAWKTKI